MFRFTRGVVGCTAIWAALLAPASSIASGGLSSIDWQVASTDAEVDRAFALARSTHRPIFLYWGAIWCPPCNQVKATLFSRPDFVERSRSFVPVYVDGDKPGAQKIASRFKVSGYPTMVVFKPSGVELTRLPGEVDPERYLLTLDGALNAGAPVKELVRRGLSGEPLTPEQWRLLSLYSWDTDDQVIFKDSELADRLGELSSAAPAQLRGVKDRLLFKAIAARATASGSAAASPSVRSADQSTIERLLGAPEAAQELRDLLLFFAEPVVAYVAPSPEQGVELARKWDGVLKQLMSDGALSRMDRVAALDARVAMWKVIDNSATLTPQRQKLVHLEIARLVNATIDRYERQAVVPEAAGVLTSAGLVDESDGILQAELSRAVAPYYHMLVLASNAKKRGDKASALRWYERAWRSSEGPATKLQWGAAYVRELVTLSPNGYSRISDVASAVVATLRPEEETFFGRNERSLQKMAMNLLRWQGSDFTRSRMVAKIKKELSVKCAALPIGSSGRANCESVFTAQSAAR